MENTNICLICLINLKYVPKKLKNFFQEEVTGVCYCWNGPALEWFVRMCISAIGKQVCRPIVVHSVTRPPDISIRTERHGVPNLLPRFCITSIWLVCVFECKFLELEVQVKREWEKKTWKHVKSIKVHDCIRLANRNKCTTAIC